MKIWTAEAQARHLVENAKVSFFLGLFLIFNVIYDLVQQYQSLSWLDPVLLGFGGFFVLVAVIYLFSKAKRGNGDKAKLFYRYSDEYIRQLSLAANTWALNTLVALLAVLILCGRFLDGGFGAFLAVEEVAYMALAILLISHSAKVLWEMREETDSLEEA